MSAGAESRPLQEICTPPDITRPGPLPGDQPYAGVLFVETSVTAKSTRSQLRFYLVLCALGPCSLAAETQKKIHEWTDSDAPQRGDTQLDDEPILNAAYLYDHRLLRGARPGELGFDLTAVGGANLDNGLTSTQASLVLRGGYGLPNTYGWSDLPSGGISGISMAPPTQGWRLYGSAARSLTGIARFLPTDGNSFEGGPSGDRDDVDLAGSGAVVLGRERFEVMLTLDVIAGADNIPGAEHGGHGAISVS